MSAANAVAPAAAIGAAASRRQGSPLRARAVAKQGKISGKFSRHGITKTTGVKSVRTVPLGARDLMTRIGADMPRQWQGVVHVSGGDVHASLGALIETWPLHMR